MTHTTEDSDKKITEKPKEEDMASKFKIHTFQAEILEKKFIFQLIKMQDSILLYVNNTDQNEFNDLSLAMISRYDNSPMGTRLIGDFNEEISKGIACRLSKKIGKVVFLSLNIEQNRMLIPQIEKRIFEEIKHKSDSF